ncbi:MAG: DUF4442 domain-containing protein [Chitinophagaceae bacterium]
MVIPSQRFIELLRHPVKFRMFLFSKLPSAYFAGVRIKDVDGSKCSATIPYKWFSQNPFRSTYFACLGMAAEMSTGALAMAYVYKSNPAVSMLVTGIKGTFIKKAINLTTFTCEDGEQIGLAIAEAISSGAAKIVEATSTGRNYEGDIIAQFVISWSFKARSLN